MVGLAGCESAASPRVNEAVPAPATLPSVEARLELEQAPEDELLTFGDVSLGMRIVELCAVDPPEEEGGPATGGAAALRSDGHAILAEVAECFQNGLLAGRHRGVVERRGRASEPGLGAERHVELRLLTP